MAEEVKSELGYTRSPKCTCECHKPDVMMLHCIPCCDGINEPGKPFRPLPLFSGQFRNWKPDEAIHSDYDIAFEKFTQAILEAKLDLGTS